MLQFGVILPVDACPLLGENRLHWCCRPSHLRKCRVLKTEHIVMDELDQLWVPEVKDWRLNERHYGDCIGETQEV